MTELSVHPLERARKALARVFQQMQTPGKGGALAAMLGTSDSSISRIKNEHMESVLCVLYSLGFKLVSEDKICVSKDELHMLRQTYARAVQNEQAAAHLFGGDE